jgi:integrase
MKRPKRLSATFVKTVTRPGRYGDGHGGHGLSLLVKPRAAGGLATSWSQRLRVNGVPCNVGLGPYPIVTLAEARAKAVENARDVHQGRDPRERARMPTFEQAAKAVHGLHASSWRNPATASIWWSSLVRFVFPVVGDKPVSSVTSGDVLSVLVPIWSTKRETARRLRQRIGVVMKWAIAKGYRIDNPAGDAVSQALPKNGTTPQRHHRALPHGDVAAAVAKVRASGAWPATKLLLEFITLTAVRSGEARLAQWNEIDRDGRVWSVPAERMKSGRLHRVPLSSGALRVLDEARALSGGDPAALVFPSMTGKALSNMTTSKLLTELGINATTHGMRSAFRSWCAETGVDREVAEAALAHVVAGVEGAYQRSDLFERRHESMEAWGHYVRPTGV